MIEFIKYIILGIIQGIAEIFPISSSGHIIIFSKILNVNIEALPIFLIIINMGSFLALLIFFRKDIRILISSSWNYLIKKEESSKEDFSYVLKLLIAVIPVGIIGLLFKDKIRQDLFTIGFSLIITSTILFVVYKSKDIQWKNDISFKQAFIISLFQMFSIIPGISRSGITMSGGLIQKIDIKKVIKFSFLSYILISVPVTLLGIYDLFHAKESIHLYGYAVAFLMSFIFSLITVRWIYKVVTVNNLVYFSIYLLIMGGLSIALYYI